MGDKQQGHPWIFGYEPDAVSAQLREAEYILKKELGVDGRSRPEALIALAQSLQLQVWIRHQARALGRLSDAMEVILQLGIGRIRAEREAEHELLDERKLRELSNPTAEAALSG